MANFGWQDTMLMPVTRGARDAWPLPAEHSCLRPVTTSPTTAAVCALTHTHRCSPRRTRNPWRPPGVLRVRGLLMPSATPSVASATPCCKGSVRTNDDARSAVLTVYFSCETDGSAVAPCLTLARGGSW